MSEQRRYAAAPHAIHVDTAEEFGRDLYHSRVDPSDPEDCFAFLADLYPNRLVEVLGNLDRAQYEAGQLYIEAEMNRNQVH